MNRIARRVQPMTPLPGPSEAIGSASSLPIGGRLALGAVIAAGFVVTLSSLQSVATFLPYAVVGCVLAIRRPRNPIGWLFVVMAISSSIATSRIDVRAADIEAGTAPAWIPLLVWLQRLGSTGIGLVIGLIATVFPSGRWPAGGVAWLSRAGVSFIAMVGILQAFAPTLRTETAGGPTVLVQNPIGVAPDWPGWRILDPGGSVYLILIAGLGLCIAGFLLRFRRATGTERAQDKWLAGSLACIVIAIAWGSCIVILAGPDPDWASDPATMAWATAFVWGPAIVAFLFPPIAVGIAILRYRLYEIDRLISRGLTYGLLTGVLAALYGASVVAIQGLLSQVAAGSTLAVAGSTLLVAALFQSLRRRIQRAVDRRFHRARYDAQRTIDHFADRLRGQVDIEMVRAEVLATVDATVQPHGAAVWLREAAG